MGKVSKIFITLINLGLSKINLEANFMKIRSIKKKYHPQNYQIIDYILHSAHF